MAYDPHEKCSCCAAFGSCRLRPAGHRPHAVGAGDGVSARAKQLHDRAIVIDSHDDTTQRLLSDKTFDIGERQTNGNIDIPRMREGGLDALFFSIWVPADVTGVAGGQHGERADRRGAQGGRGASRTIWCWRRPPPTSGAPRRSTRSPR